MHFDSVQFVEESVDSTRDSRTKLKRKRLISTAVPSKFPNLPHYYSKSISVPRSSASSTASRFQKEENIQNQKNELFLKSDVVTCLSDLIEKLKNEPSLSETDIICQKTCIALIKTEISPNFGAITKCSLVINEQLEFSAFVKQNHLPATTFSHIFNKRNNKIKTVSQAVNIWAFVKASLEEGEESINDYNNVLDKISSLRSTVEKCEFEGCNSSMKQKLILLCEQLSLACCKSSYSKRYSSNLIAIASVWCATSTAAYKAILKDDFISVPSIGMINHLVKSLTVEVGYTHETEVYLQTRIKSLSSFERNCILLIDEIYTAKRLEFQNGKLFGFDNGAPTKTLCGFMLTSISGKYKDMISLSQVGNLNAATLKKIFDIILPSVTKIGFSIVGISVDNFSANRKFYEHELCNKKISSSIPHPLCPGEEIYLVYDSTHVFKNVYNAWIKKRIFVCPDFLGMQIGTVNFDHLEILAKLESGKPIKISYKLNDKVLYSRPIERTNVKLSDATFHESTINGLKFYSENGHPEFLGTMRFLELIRKWWNIVNVKTPDAGRKKRDPTRNPIYNENSPNIQFLIDFCKWVKEWEKSSDSKNFLTKETANAMCQTSTSLVGLARYLITKKGYSYVLLGHAQSDPIEREFGRYRQMSGACYFVSVRQILNSAKSIRLQALLKFSKVPLSEFSKMLEKTAIESDKAELADAQVFVNDLDIEEINIEFQEDNIADQNVIFFVSGYISYSLLKTTKRECCQKSLYESLEAPLPKNFDSKEETHKLLHTLANRGGLVTASDFVFCIAIYCYKFYMCISEKEDLKSRLLNSRNSLSFFSKALIVQLTGDISFGDIVNTECENGHLLTPIIEKISVKMFNLIMSNFLKEQNDQIRLLCQKRGSGEKATTAQRKVSKLSSSKL